MAWGDGYKPGGISDYLTSDQPVLGLRVNSFTDKTVVTLQWQHVAFDALGMQYVIEGWSAMLWGKVESIPRPCKFDPDPFDQLGRGTRPAQEEEEHVLADRQVGIGGILKWGLGYGVDMLLRAKENRMVCIPESFWRPQLENALEELRAEALEKGEDASKVFLTENDIVTAWIIRWVVGPMELNPEKLVSPKCHNPRTYQPSLIIQPARCPGLLPCLFARRLRVILSPTPRSTHTLATPLAGPTFSLQQVTLCPSHQVGWRVR